jgi:hypothetical protein
MLSCHAAAAAQPPLPMLSTIFSNAGAITIVASWIHYHVTTHMKSFTHQSVILPVKILMHELKQKYVVLTL